VADETHLARLRDSPPDAVRPDFKRKMEALRQHVLASCPAKAAGGKVLSPTDYGCLVAGFVNVLNSGATPTAQSLFAAMENQREMYEAVVWGERVRLQLQQLGKEAGGPPAVLGSAAARAARAFAERVHAEVRPAAAAVAWDSPTGELVAREIDGFAAACQARLEAQVDALATPEVADLVAAVQAEGVAVAAWGEAQAAEGSRLTAAFGTEALPPPEEGQLRAEWRRRRCEVYLGWAQGLAEEVTAEREALAELRCRADADREHRAALEAEVRSRSVDDEEVALLRQREGEAVEHAAALERELAEMRGAMAHRLSRVDEALADVVPRSLLLATEARAAAAEAEACDARKALLAQNRQLGALETRLEAAERSAEALAEQRRALDIELAGERGRNKMLSEHYNDLRNAETKRRESKRQRTELASHGLASHMDSIEQKLGQLHQPAGP
jgi:hypothetical protein